MSILISDLEYIDRDGVSTSIALGSGLIYYTVAAHEFINILKEATHIHIFYK